DRAKHERVVGIQPERDLLLARPLVDDRRAELVHVAVELGSIALERAVIDVPAANVEVEDLVERLPPRCVGGRFLGVRCRDQQRRGDHDRKTQRPHTADYTRWERKRASAASNTSGCSRLERCPAAGICTSSAPAIARCISTAFATGVTVSSSPTRIKVGTWIVASSGVESGRDINARIAPAMATGGLARTSSRTCATTSGRSRRVVSPSSRGI